MQYRVSNHITRFSLYRVTHLFYLWIGMLTMSQGGSSLMIYASFMLTHLFGRIIFLVKSIYFRPVTVKPWYTFRKQFTHYHISIYKRTQHSNACNNLIYRKTGFATSNKLINSKIFELYNVKEINQKEYSRITLFIRYVANFLTVSSSDQIREGFQVIEYFSVVIF